MAIALLCLLAGSAGAAARGPVWRSGAFVGYGGAGDEEFGVWRGAAIQTATDYIGSDDWSQIEDPAWAISQWRAMRGVVPDLSVALWPASGGSLAEAASGAYDEHFAALARNLVAGGLGGAGIRLGWEFNGTWYRWSVRSAGDAAEFAAAWRRVVVAMRSVPGARFSFDWAANLQSTGIDPELAYPGDAYVSDIGMDVYDWNESGANEAPSARWNDIVNKGYGLAWQARFAAAHGKPIAFPEWGLVSYAPNPGLAGGDDPVFVQNMFSWFQTHNVAFENYFDADAPALGQFFGLTTGSGRFPNAAAVYQQLYAGHVAVPITTPKAVSRPARTCANARYGKRAMRNLAVTATIGASVLAITACGQSPQVRTQHQEIVYQAKVARIDMQFARPTVDARRAQLLLTRAIKQYSALRPPKPLWTLHSQLIAALKNERRAIQQAVSAADVRARSDVARILRRMSVLIGACRADAAHC